MASTASGVQADVLIGSSQEPPLMVGPGNDWAGLLWTSRVGLLDDVGQRGAHDPPGGRHHCTSSDETVEGSGTRVGIRRRGGPPDRMPADQARRDGVAVSKPAVVALQYRDDLAFVGFVAMLKKGFRHASRLQDRHSLDIGRSP